MRRISVGTGAALAVAAAAGAVLLAQGSSVATGPGCLAVHARATELVLEGDRATGAALATQAQGKAAFRAANRPAVATLLAGYRMVAADPECFDADERSGVDLQVLHLENLLRTYDSAS